MLGKKAEVDNIDPMQAGENVAAIYDDMDTTGVYLQERFTALNEYIDAAMAVQAQYKRPFNHFL